MSQAPPPSDDAFAHRLREAISARGLSLERLRAHLAQDGHHVSVATLSYWQTARSRPHRAASLAALSSLEEILDVERGALASLLPVRRRPTRSTFVTHLDPARTGPDHGPAHGAALAAVVEQLGLSWDDGLNRISVHEIVDVEEGGLGRTVLARELLVAQRSIVTRFPLWVEPDDAAVSVDIVERRNCTVTAIVPTDSSPAAVAEVTLSRPLTAGQAMTVEYTVELTGGGVPMTQHLRPCPAPVRELHTQLRFAGHTLPRAAGQFVVIGEQRRASPLPLKGPVLDVRHSEFGPGIAGIEWTW